MDIDGELKSELLETFNDLATEIEILLSRILDQDTQEDLNTLFRHFHTIKGNAAILHLHSIVHYTHGMEEIMSSLRDRKYKASLLLCEVIQLGIDRLRDLHLRELNGVFFENLQEQELCEYYETLAQLTQENIDPKCQEIINFLSFGVITSEDEAMTQEQDIVCYTTPEHLSKQKYDLIFFQGISQQIDRLNIYWRGRSEQIHEWASKMNGLANNAVNPAQLSAACYLHDFGMSLIPYEILQKTEALNEEETEQVQLHPSWGYNYLIRIPGWEEAATIILEHHERIDGNGYPFKNSGDIIHDGAKILAIIDAFFSIINGRADRAQRRSIVRAIAEINTRIGIQFDAKWVNIFNEMLRIELRSGNL